MRIHDVAYDKQQFVNLLIAIKDHNEVLFSQSLVNLVSGLGSNLAAQRQIFLQVFVYLYVRGNCKSVDLAGFGRNKDIFEFGFGLRA